MAERQPITEEKALSRLASLCSRSEQAEHDLRRKMTLWLLPDEAQNRVVKRLRDECYIDDDRYCHAFVREKMRFNRWGRRKIEQALRMKHLPESSIAIAIDEEMDDTQEDTLRSLIESKRRTIKAKSDYDMNAKLIRFALSRGFEMDEVMKVLGL